MSSPDEWSTLPVSTESQVAWSQPYAPRLETVAVSTESQVAWSQPYAPRLETSASPPPMKCGSCGQQQVDAEVSVFVPALFDVLFHLGAAATQGPVHGAQPVSPPRR